MNDIQELLNLTSSGQQDCIFSDVRASSGDRQNRPNLNEIRHSCNGWEVGPQELPHAGQGQDKRLIPSLLLAVPAVVHHHGHILPLDLAQDLRLVLQNTRQLTSRLEVGLTPLGSSRLQGPCSTAYGTADYLF